MLETSFGPQLLCTDFEANAIQCSLFKEDFIKAIL